MHLGSCDLPGRLLEPTLCPSQGGKGSSSHVHVDSGQSVRKWKLHEDSQRWWHDPATTIFRKRRVVDKVPILLKSMVAGLHLLRRKHPL